MTTHTHNHLLLTANYLATAGPFIGETASYGVRVCVGGGGGPQNVRRPDLAAGQIDLNTFDAHTALENRALSISAVSGTMAANWTGDAVPTEENVTASDQDFLVQKFGEMAMIFGAAIPGQYAMKFIKLYAVDAKGKSPLGPNTWTPSGTFGGVGGSYNTPDVAMCVSLYTAHRQKSGRGRIYVGPLNVSVVDAFGLFTTAIRDTNANAMKAFCDAVGTRGTPDLSATYRVIVWNRHPAGQTTGDGLTGCIVNKVRVGDEPDLQERRTKGRPETYTEKTVV